MTGKRPTQFQTRVYAAVSRIPEGWITTYKLVATEVGCSSCRAVGQALRKNPFAPTVPCHRVIASDLSIGGFRGCTKGPVIQRKQALLEREGVSFHRGKLRNTDQVYRFK